VSRDFEGLLHLLRDRLSLDARRVASRFTRRIFGGAALSRCDATCCKGGVAVSVVERDNILRHAGAVAGAMEASPRPGAPTDPSRWFTREKRDPDFLAGRSADTRVAAGSCVFLRADSLCAVHVASEKAAGHPYALKPAYCILFPICVEKGAVDVCRGSYTRKPDCCSPVREGSRTPASVMAGTLETLGDVRARRPARLRGRARA